jgi:hypothetical protein
VKGAIAMDSRKTFRLPPLAAGAIALLLIAGGASCKFGTPSYTLTVIVPDTITGSPASGEYTYKELTSVNFSYTAVNPLYSVEVYLNGKLRYGYSGSIYLYGDGYTLAPDIIDDRGNWTITMMDTSATSATYTFTLTLSGPDVLSGTFTDSRGFHGTWTGASGTLLLTYTDWYDFVLTGTVYGLGAGTSGSYVGNSTTGTWGAKKAS